MVFSLTKAGIADVGEYFRLERRRFREELRKNRVGKTFSMSTILEYQSSANPVSAPSVFPVLDINAKKPVSNPERIAWSRPYAWSTVIPAVRRQESIEGALIGCAIGEGIARLSLARRRLFAGNPGEFLPGKLVPSHRTEGMLVTVQAVLLSQAMSEQFISFLSQRLGWYQRLQPLACVQAFIGSIRDRSQSAARFGDDPLIRALALSVLMQGHHDGVLSWVQDSTQLSCSSRWVTQASFLVATAAQCAQFHRTAHEVKVSELLESLRQATGSKEVQQRLDGLIDAKRHGASAAEASKILGGKDAWQDQLVDNALLAIYTYARHPERIERGLGELSALQGDLRGVMSVYGSLSAIHTSLRSLSESWQDAVTLYPYSKAWVQHYVDRCADWPHGPEDIQATRCLPSHPIGQLIRNLSRGFL